MTAALLLVDLQHDFLGRRGLVPHGAEIVRAAARLLEHARTRGLPVVHVRTIVAPDGHDAMPHWRERSPTPCRRGTAGAAPPPELAERSGEAVLEKRHYDAFEVDALDAHLRERGVTQVVLAGVYLHACLRETALSARRRGYDVVFAEDAVGTTEPVHGAATRAWLEARGFAFVSVADVVVERSDSRPAGEDPTVGLRGLPEAERAEILARWGGRLRARESELVETMIEEIAKPRRLAREELARAHAHLQVASELRVEEPAGPGVRIRFRPRGTVAVVTPWNNPVAIPVGKLAPALFFGNAVVWKPSPRAPRASALVLETLREVGVGDDVVRDVEGGADAARRLAASSALDALTFTGSEEAGRQMAAACAVAGTPFQGELGGNNAALVGTGADPHVVAERVVEGAFAFAGQRCTALRRLVVVRDALPDVLDALLERVRGLPVLPPQDAEAPVGPLVDDEQRRRIESVVARATRDGVRVLAGGRVPDAAPPGAFYLPTVLQADAPELEVVQEESFGPLLVVQPAVDFQDALRLANGVRQGLVAVLFSHDADEQAAFLERAEAGILRVNPEDFALDPRAPFGGRKRSGWGPPEHGVFDRELYAVPQAVYGG